MKKVITIFGTIFLCILSALLTVLVIMSFGLIKENKIDLLIEVSSQTKIYDGTPLYASDYEIKQGKLKDNHYLVPSYEGFVTNVNEIVSTDVSFKVIDENSKDVTSDYDISIKQGELQIEKKEIFVTLLTDELTYGENLSLDEEDYELDSSLPINEKLVSVLSLNDENNIDLSFKIIDEMNKDVTINYDISSSFDSISLIKRKIQIKPYEMYKEYDGNKIELNYNFDYCDNSLKLANGDYLTFDYKYTSELASCIKNPDCFSSEIYIDPDKVYIYNSKGYDVTSYYDIDCAKSVKIGIYQKVISLEFNNFEYGNKLDSSSVTLDTLFSNASKYKDLNLSFDENILNEFLTENAKKDVGTYRYVEEENSLFGSLSKNYYFSYGEYSILKRKIYVSLNDTLPSSYSYNGKNYQVIRDNINVVDENGSYPFNDISAYLSDDIGYISSKINDESNQYAYFEYITLNKIQILKNLDNGYKDITSNFDIIFKNLNNKISISKAKIEIKPIDQTKIYDGTSSFKNEYEIVDGLLIGRDYIKEVNYHDIDEINVNDNIITSIDSIKIYNSNNDDVTSYYEITYSNGKNVITPSNKILKFNSIIYSEGFSNKIFSNDDASFNNFDSINNEIKKLDVGEYDMSNYSQYLSSTNNNYNYELGSLIISKKEISPSIKLSENTKTYDGEKTTLTSNEISLSLDDQFVISNIETVSSFKESNDPLTSINIAYIETINVKSFIILLDNKNVTKNFEINYPSVDIIVNKKYLYIKLKDVSKIYDGEVLSSSEYELVNNTSLANGDYIKNIKEVSTNSSFANKYSLSFSEANIYSSIFNKDVTSYYNIVYEEGTLIIEKQILKININIDEEKIYDGKETSLSIKNLIYSLDNKFELSNIKYNSTKNPYLSNDEVAYRETLTINSFEILFNGNNVSDNFDINCPEIQIMVYKKDLNIKLKDISKIYDGEVLSSNEYELVNNTSLANGDSINVNYVSTSSSKAKEYSLKFNNAKIINSSNEDVTSYYNIVYEEGILTINKKTITAEIINIGESRTYDGKNTSIYLNNISLVGLDNGEIDYEVDYIKSDYFGTDTSIAYIEKIILNITSIVLNDEELIDNYQITYANSSINISKYAVEFEISSDYKTSYDGKDYSSLNKNNFDLYKNDVIKNISENNLVSNHKVDIDYEYSNNQKLVYTYKISSLDILNENNENVTSYYSFNNLNNEEFKITITKAKLNYSFVNQTVSYVDNEFDENTISDEFLLSMFRYDSSSLKGDDYIDFNSISLEKENQNQNENSNLIIYKVYLFSITIKNQNDNSSRTSFYDFDNIGESIYGYIFINK